MQEGLPVVSNFEKENFFHFTVNTTQLHMRLTVWNTSELNIENEIVTSCQKKKISFAFCSKLRTIYIVVA